MKALKESETRQTYKAQRRLEPRVNLAAHAFYRLTRSFQMGPKDTSSPGIYNLLQFFFFFFSIGLQYLEQHYIMLNTCKHRSQNCVHTWVLKFYLNDREQYCPMELPATMEMSYICPLGHGSHQPYMANGHLEYD